MLINWFHSLSLLAQFIIVGGGTVILTYLMVWALNYGLHFQKLRMLFWLVFFILLWWLATTAVAWPVNPAYPNLELWFFALIGGSMFLGAVVGLWHFGRIESQKRRSVPRAI